MITFQLILLMEADIYTIHENVDNKIYIQKTYLKNIRYIL